MTNCIEQSKIRDRKANRTNKNLNMNTDSKISIQQSIIFLHTSNNQLGNVVGKRNTSNKIHNVAGINLTEEVRVLYGKSYKYIIEGHKRSLNHR
jgi:hypothetical protein